MLTEKQKEERDRFQRELWQNCHKGDRLVLGIILVMIVTFIATIIGYVT